jgi:hypothetical protein
MREDLEFRPVYRNPEATPNEREQSKALIESVLEMLATIRPRKGPCCQDRFSIGVQLPSHREKALQLRLSPHSFKGE